MQVPLDRIQQKVEMHEKFRVQFLVNLKSL